MFLQSPPPRSQLKLLESTRRFYNLNTKMMNRINGVFLSLWLPLMQLTGLITLVASAVAGWHIGTLFVLNETTHLRENMILLGWDIEHPYLSLCFVYVAIALNESHKIFDVDQYPNDPIGTAAR